EQDHAGLDDRGPVFRLTLALAHARLGRDGGDRLLREDADVQPALAADEVRRRDAARLDGLGAEPAALDRLQAQLAERHRVAAGGVAAHLAPLALAVLDPLGHQRHDSSPSSGRSRALSRKWRSYLFGPRPRRGTRAVAASLTGSGSR